MKLKLTWLLTLFMAFVMQFSFAQEKTVTGTVTTVADGLPLPGASVIVKGTARGAQTDFDGKYTIKVNQGDVLVISYVGMDPAEVTIAAGNTYDVALEDGSTLDEVVVVGYGTTTKKSFTGSASVVEAKNIETKNFSNVTQSLAGEAAGVQVFNTSGQPGTVSTVRIRGFGSVNGNRAPLYVVDGVPYYDVSSLNAVNPGDIKSTTILKDATATAIYGSRGANGVVLITTKSGSSTESYIEVDVRTGINDQLIPRYDVVTSPEEAIGYVWEGLLGRGRATGLADPVAFANNTLFTNNGVNIGYNMWNVADAAALIDPATRTVRQGVTRKYTPQSYRDAAFDSAYRTEANVRIAGGNEDTRYFISGGFLDEDGYSINSGYKRYSTRINVTSKVKEWLKLSANIGYAYSDQLQNGQTNGSENLFEFADKMQPFFPVFLRDDNAQLVADPIFGGFQYDYGTPSGFRPRPNANLLNPIASALYDYNNAQRHEVNGSFKLDFKLTKDLTFETSFGAVYYSNVFKSVGNQFYGVSVGNGGDIFIRDRQRLDTNFLQLLRYRRDFGNHTVEALAAHESNSYSLTQEDASKSTAVIPGVYELDNFINVLSPPSGFQRERNLESYFGQINYDYDDKYYLSGSFRSDGSSRFSNPDDRWDTFFSVGAGWVLSNEAFLENSNLFTYLKLKGSFGTTGEEKLPGNNFFYTGENAYSAGNLNGGVSIGPATGQQPFRLEGVTWETAEQFQVGLEFTLGSFLDGSVDFFQKDTKNLFVNKGGSPSTGASSFFDNDGELRNTGVEFELTGHIIDTDDFQLDVSLNGSMYDNEVLVNPIGGDGLERVYDQQLTFFAMSPGYSIFDFHMREWAGVDPSDGAPMWYQYYDDIDGNGIFDAATDTPITNLTIYRLSKNQDGTLVNPDANIRKTITKSYDEGTTKFIGKSSIPDVSGAFRVSANYKNWNLSTQFTYGIGGYAYDAQYAELMSDRFGAAGNNFHSDIRDRWQNPGDITDVPALTDNAVTNGTSTSSRFIIKNDFFALNNILLGYTMPSKFLDKTGLDSVNIYVSGDNLFINSVRDGFNPTTSQTGNTGRRQYAPLSTFTLGVKLKF